MIRSVARNPNQLTSATSTEMAAPVPRPGAAAAAPVAAPSEVSSREKDLPTWANRSSRVSPSASSARLEGTLPACLDGRVDGLDDGLATGVEHGGR